VAESTLPASSQESISPANAADLELMNEIGYGSAPLGGGYGIYLSPDGQRLIVTTTAGVAVLSAGDLSLQRFIPSPSGGEYAVTISNRAPTVVSRDGTLAASTYPGALEEMVRVWDLTTGAVLGDFPVPRWPTQDDYASVAKLDISPDNSLLAAVYTDGVIAVMSLPGGESVKVLAWYIDYTAQPMYLRFDRTGRFLYDIYLDVGFGDQGIQSRVLKTSNWTEDSYYATKRGRGPSSEGVFSPTLSDTGFEFGYFPKAYYGGQLRWGIDVMDVRTLYERYFIDMPDYPSAFNVSGDGRWLVSASSVTDKIEVREAEKKGPPAMTFPGHDNLVWGVAAAPDGQAFYSVGLDGFLRKWVPGSQTPAAEQDGFLPAIGGVTFNEDGTLLRVAATTGSVFEVDASSGRLTRTFTDSREPRRYFWKVATYDAFFPELQRVASLDGSCTLASQTGGNWLAQTCNFGILPIELWDTSTTTLLRTLSDPSYTVQDKWGPRLKSGISNAQMAVSPDGAWIAATYHTPLDNNDIRIFDSSTGRAVRVITSRQVATMAFSPDGSLLATAPYDPDRPLRILDPQTGKVAKEIRPPAGSGRIDAIAFTPDGSKLLVLDGLMGSVRAYDTATWSAGPALTIPLEMNLLFKAMRVSPDGSLVALADYSGVIYFWDMQSAKLELDPLKPDGAVEIRDLAFSPDGLRLATVGADNRIRVFGLPQ
jgi:WD40 repeat protein